MRPCGACRERQQLPPPCAEKAIEPECQSGHLGFEPGLGRMAASVPPAVPMDGEEAARAAAARSSALRRCRKAPMGSARRHGAAGGYDRPASLQRWHGGSGPCRSRRVSDIGRVRSVVQASAAISPRRPRLSRSCSNLASRRPQPSSLAVSAVRLGGRCPSRPSTMRAGPEAGAALEQPVIAGRKQRRSARSRHGPRRALSSSEPWDRSPSPSNSSGRESASSRGSQR